MFGSARVRHVEAVLVSWRDVLTVLDTIDHRIARLSGDAIALADAMREARAGAAVDCWARESYRIGQELASLLEVVEKVKPDPVADGDTNVEGIPIGELSREDDCTETREDE